MNGNGCSPIVSGTRQNMKSAVRVWELMRRRTITAVLVSSSAWESMPITGEEFEEVGPGSADLFVHAEVRNRVGQFEARIAIQSKFLDGDWGPPPGSLATADIVLGNPTVLNSDNYYRNLFVDRGRTGAMAIRLLLQYRTASTPVSGAIGDRADLTISVTSNPLCS